MNDRTLSYNPTKVARLAEINAKWDRSIGWNHYIAKYYEERKQLMLDVSRMVRRNKNAKHGS